MEKRELSITAEGTVRWNSLCEQGATCLEHQSYYHRATALLDKYTTTQTCTADVHSTIISNSQKVEGKKTHQLGVDGWNVTCRRNGIWLSNNKECGNSNALQCVWPKAGKSKVEGPHVVRTFPLVGNLQKSRNDLGHLMPGETYSRVVLTTSSLLRYPINLEVNRFIHEYRVLVIKWPPLNIS